MEKRVIFAFILSLAVLYGFRWLFTPPATVPETAASVQPAEPSPTPPAATSTKPPNAPTASSAPAPATNLRAEKAEEFGFDTPLYTATLSNAGGTLRSYKLKAYADADGKTVPHSIVWQGGIGDQSIPADPAKRNAAYQVDASFKTINLRSIKEPQEVTSARAGVEDQYFLAMFLMPDPVPVKVHKQEFPGPDGKPAPHLYLSAAVPEGEAIRVYVGPKDRQWLSRTDPQLVAVINYGWFEIIARPLEVALLTIHSYIGNFGWSIVLLTLVINLVLFPLRLKQQVSMQKMQKIQPQMKTLQDKYKKLKANDPKRPQVQAEMMDLYKQHGVNPLGGCLPLLLQMPVF